MSTQIHEKPAEILVLCPAVHAPPPLLAENVWWLIVTSTFLIWNVSNQIAERTIKSRYTIRHRSSKWPPRFYSEVFSFCVEERTLCVSALFF